jgi:hypothetical protein
MMSTTDILLLIAGVTTSMSTILTLMNNARIAAIQAKADAIKAQADLIQLQGKEIHGLVDGSLTAAQTHAASLQKENQAQKEIITRLTPPPDSVVVLTQKVLALEAEAARTRSQGPTSVIPPPPTT